MRRKCGGAAPRLAATRRGGDAWSTLQLAPPLPFLLMGPMGSGASGLVVELCALGGTITGCESRRRMCEDILSMCDLVLASLGYHYRETSAGDFALEPAFTWKGQENYNLLADAVVGCVRAKLVSIGLVELPTHGFATPGLTKHKGPVLLLVCGTAPGGDAGVRC